MKKPIVIMAAIILYFLMAFSIAYNNPPAGDWEKLKQNKLKGLLVVYEWKENRVKIKMVKVRQALERAGIDEPVTLELAAGDKIREDLGTYCPVWRRRRRRNRVTFNSIPQILSYGTNPTFYRYFISTPPNSNKTPVSKVKITRSVVYLSIKGSREQHTVPVGFKIEPKPRLY